MKSFEPWELWGSVQVLNGDDEDDDGGADPETDGEDDETFGEDEEE